MDISKENLSDNLTTWFLCMYLCFSRLHNLIEFFLFFLSGCVLRSHIYSSSLLSREHVCRKATDAFILCLYDGSGASLKIFFLIPFVDQGSVWRLNVPLLYFVFQLMFVLGAYLSPTLVEEQTRCSVLAMFIHYFFLCQFSWMFIEVRTLLSDACNACRMRRNPKLSTVLLKL